MDVDRCQPKLLEVYGKGLFPVVYHLSGDILIMMVQQRRYRVNSRADSASILHRSLLAFRAVYYLVRSGLGQQLKQIAVGNAN